MRLDRIYTRGGDTGETSLGDGLRVPKYHIRVETLGSLDEANASIGVALLYIAEAEIKALLQTVQNDLFDLGADLARPQRVDAKKQVLRISEHQVTQLEENIDRFNEELNPLTTFVLPGGSSAAAYLHLARTILRRAERQMADLAAHEPINAEALKYVNRLSDLLFVLARFVNDKGRSDVLWHPGLNR
ncbi:MAG TPA: cob(I)yrinic acid a,c-diamide adenosyltransferase [Micropepsaceae bacterium]|nr:cob(I)yrinic acid a,c-diamide adenosyltransferase [Micropepsaceae bacterium]